MDVSQLILWPDVIANLDCNSDRFRSAVLAIDLLINSDQGTKNNWSSGVFCIVYTTKRMIYASVGDLLFISVLIMIRLYFHVLKV